MTTASSTTAAATAAMATASSPPPSAVSASSSSTSSSSVVPSAEPIAKRVVLPRCATWFALDAISSLEKRLLPEFFEHEALHRTQFPPGAKLPSSKTPQIYMKYRNYMVHAYRQQPHVYLTATACRRNLAGDACAIMRVHEFLTHWGIINYDVPPHAMPPTVAANYALKPSSSTNPEFQSIHNIQSIQSNSQRSGALAISGPHHHSLDQKTVCERCGAGDVAFELTPEAKRKARADVSHTLPLTAFALAPGSGICDDCYLARSFPEGVEIGDFVRVEPKPQWTADEDARLLDAVSSSTATGPQQEALDWNVISAKVQTKRADECVVRFLELPLLPQVQDQSGSTLAAPTFAYAPSLNASVLDMAALVRDVDPFVAKAAARAAIQAIQELHKLPPREVVAAVGGPGATQTQQLQPPQQDASNGSVKQEARSGTDESGDVEMTTNGSAVHSTTTTTTTIDDKATVDAAAAAVVSAGDAAGIVAIKTEQHVNGTSDDVDMSSAPSGSVAPTSKETLAVVQEAAHATAAALLASKAHAAAQQTARGAMRDLTTQVLENQLQQLELKMQQVAVLEKALVTEKESLTRERHALYMDRLAFAQLKIHGGNTAAL